MARHQIRAAKPKPEKPKSELRAAPSWYDRTHPVGSAERFLDQAAKEALAAAAAGGLAEPRQLAAGAVKAIAKKASEYPDPLLQRAAELPAAELAKRAARAEAYNQAMKAQNGVVQAMTASMSPVADLARSQASAALATRQAAKGGDAGADETPVSGGQAPAGGPRIVINPTTFKNSKDALCVAFNEGFRLWMEANDFEPQSEPTDAQRKFFSDTAYADDEVQLRRTILARIATFDTSVKDPTDDQLSETASFLNAVLESDWCRNDWERNSVQKLARAVEASVGAEPVEPKAEPVEPRAEEPLQARADLGGGETTDEEDELARKATSSALAGLSNMEPDRTEPQAAEVPEAPPVAETPPAPETAVAESRAESAAETPVAAPAAEEAVQQEGDVEQPQNGMPTLATYQIVQDERPSGGTSGHTVAERRERHPLRMNGPSIAPVRPIGDIGATSFTDTKRMNGPSIEPERAIGDMGATSFTDTKRMNGPSIEPARPIGAIDTADGSGGSTLRRKKRQRSRT